MVTLLFQVIQYNADKVGYTYMNFDLLAKDIKFQLDLAVRQVI